jgi:hypothetical protein
MRRLRFKLKSLMIAVAFAALILAVIIQGALLRRAAIHADMFRAEAERQRDIAARESARARAATEHASKLAKWFSQDQDRQP